MDLSRYKVFLLDMDGTIYLGDRLFGDTPVFLSRLRESGRELVFLTNNSSRDSAAYLRKLRRLGIKVSAREVFTSGDATMLALQAKKPGASIYLLGTPSLRRSFERAGFRMWREEGGGFPDYLVVGFDTTLNYQKLTRACRLAASGIPYLATHPDFNCPVPGGFIPDAGSIIAFIEASTGKKPEVIGKPQPGIVDTLIAREGWKPDEMVMVGDRLYTDIALGMNAGIATILVYSGETSKDAYEAQEEFQATWAVAGVGAITPYL
jgi:HAD superfamily hydrolase (TIGR01450 family)